MNHEFICNFSRTVCNYYMWLELKEPYREVAVTMNFPSIYVTCVHILIFYEETPCQYSHTLKSKESALLHHKMFSNSLVKQYLGPLLKHFKKNKVDVLSIPVMLKSGDLYLSCELQFPPHFI